MSSNSPAAVRNHGSAPPMYWCHECAIEMRPLMTPGPTCPRCNGEFVEEIDPSNPIPGEEETEEDDVNMPGPERLFSGAAATRDQLNNPGGDQAMDLGSLVGGILRGLATAGSQPRPAGYQPPSSQPGGSTATPSQVESNSNENSNNNGSSSNSSSSNNFRTGTSQVGPLNVSWGIQQTTFRNQQGGTTTSNMQGFNPDSFSRIQPLGLSDYLRQSFDTDDYRHDDGMGGAGGAADGRFFNMDNRTNRPETDQQTGNNDDNDGDSNGYPPELASIRDVFANLFGGMGDGPASMLIDLFGGGTGRGRMGDYVWGQQGLDDVITQLMDQTRGSTAPPPASDEAINQLERFSRKELKKVRQARNRECATCMDSFEEEEENPEPSMDSNRLSSTLMTPSEEVDDPPEVVPLEDQQDELMMMPCKHLFHLDCLQPWLKTNGTCPVCRVSLEKDATKTNEAAAPTSEEGVDQQNHSSTSVTTMNPISNDEDESHDVIRERSRRAAESRMTSTSTTETRDPLALQPDELD